MTLLDQLRETWPVEDVEPYGNVLVIPNKAFKQEWKEQLQSEGVKIYAQAYHGETCLFLKENSVKAEGSQVEVSPLRLGSKAGRWSSQDESTLKELHSQGLPLREIALKLNRKKPTVYEKARRMGLIQTQTETTESIPDMPKPQLEDSTVKELLSACSLLYPTHKTACAYLLREASNKILAEK